MTAAIEVCPICGGCPQCNSEDERDLAHLRTLDDVEEARRLMTGLLDAFDERWTGQKRPPKVYYDAERFIARIVDAALNEGPRPPEVSDE